MNIMNQLYYDYDQEILKKVRKPKRIGIQVFYFIHLLWI